MSTGGHEMLDLLFKFILICNVVILGMSIFDDYFISKLFLKKSPLKKAKIVYFNDYSWNRDRFDFSVVEYMDEKNITYQYFVRRRKKDKIGDIITVVSNEFIAVRPEAYKKKDSKMYAWGIFWIVVSMLYLIRWDCIYMTIQEILIYILVVIVLFFGYIGVDYLQYKIIVKDHFMR